ELDVLPIAFLHHAHGGVALTERPHDRLHQIVWRAGGRGDADGPHALEPGRVDVVRALDAPGVAGQVISQLDQSHAVGTGPAGDDEEQVDVRGDRPYGVLAVLGGEAQVVGGRHEQAGEALAQQVDGLHRVVDGQRRLGEDHDLLGVGNLDGARVGQGWVVLAIAD